jgi:hypothetical protein
MNNGIAISFLAILTGCNLQFGCDEMTTQPNQAQLARCRPKMYLQANLAFQDHGMKLLESGIDDQIWLKFSYQVTDPAQMFQTDIVDVSKFFRGFTFSPYKGHSLVGC